MDVSKRIIKLREACGLTQNGLAEKAGVSGRPATGTGSEGTGDLIVGTPDGGSKDGI